MSERKPLTDDNPKNFQLGQEDDHTAEFNARQLEICKLRADNAKLRKALEEAKQVAINEASEVTRLIKKAGGLR